MIGNEIYCYTNGFLKWNISKKTSYNVENKKMFGKICILNLWNRKASIFAGAIIRNERWKKITKETDKIIIKSIYRWNNWMKFRKLITRGEILHFRRTIDTSRSRTRRIQLSYSISLKKFFCFNLRKRCCSEAVRFKVGSSLSFSNLEMP